MSSYKLKVLLTGSIGSEASQLVQRFIKKRFAANYKLTVGVDILTKDVEYKPGKIATLSIWDIGGQQRFDFIRNTFYKGAAAAIIVFNLNNIQSFDESINFLRGIRKESGENIPVILVGNRTVTDEKNISEIEKEDVFAIDECIYIESSTTNGENINRIFTEITQRVIDSRKSKKKNKK